MRSGACARAGVLAAELQAKQTLATSAAATPSGKRVPAHAAAYSHQLAAPCRLASSRGVAPVMIRRANEVICADVGAGGSSRRNSRPNSRSVNKSLGLINQPRRSGASALRSWRRAMCKCQRIVAGEESRSFAISATEKPSTSKSCTTNRRRSGRAARVRRNSSLISPRSVTSAGLGRESLTSSVSDSTDRAERDDEMSNPRFTTIRESQGQNGRDRSKLSMC